MVKWTHKSIQETHLHNKAQSTRVSQGAYDDEDKEAATSAYDLVALKYWGQDTIFKFSCIKLLRGAQGDGGQSKEEYIGSLRRKSNRLLLSTAELISKSFCNPKLQPFIILNSINHFPSVGPPKNLKINGNCSQNTNM